MTCTFEYKGKTFNSELELDDFLLASGHKLYSAYGDMVFNKPTAQLITDNKIESYKEEGLRRLSEKFTRNLDNTPGHVDLEQETVKPPYIAITKFLSGCRNPKTGKLLFPEFRPEFINEDGQRDGYFPRKEEQWASHVFTTREVVDFFDGDTSKINLTFTTELFKEFRKILEEKWVFLGRIGTEIHGILQKIFRTSKTEDGKTLKYYEFTEELLFKYIKDTVNLDLLSEDNIKDVIHYGKSLYKYLCKYLDHDDLTFYPEYIIWGNFVDDLGEQQLVLGKIDLLVTDKYGKTHIIDYKTSPEDYSEQLDSPNGYSSAKVLAFKYLLSAYNLLTQQLGFGNSSTLNYVAPMLLTNFHKDEKGKWIFDKIKAYDNYIDNLSENIQETANIQATLKLYFINLSTPDAPIEQLLTNYQNDINNLFNAVDRNEYTDEDITAIILRRAKKNKASSMFEYKTPSGEIKKFKTEKELRDWLKKVLEHNRVKVEVFTNRLADVISSTVSGEDPTLYSDLFPVFEFEDGSSKWINETLKKYYDGNYTVIDNDSAKQLRNLGVILVKNNYTNAVDVIKISDKVLFGYNILARGRKKITAKFSDDVIEESRNKMVFESMNGNIEIMKTMLLLNAIPETLRGKFINEIRVLNPTLASGTWAPNEQIIYNFNRLDELSNEKSKATGKDVNLKINNFYNGAIKFNDSYLQFVNEYETIIKKHTNIHDTKWNKFIASTTVFDREVTGFDNVIEVTAELKKLKDNIESKFPQLKEIPKDWDTTDDAELLYFRVNLAISYLSNVNYLQQFADSDRILDSINILKSGATGTRIDNPGRLKNENLNKSVRLTTEGYQNLRLEILELKAELRDAINALKKAKGFGYISGRLWKNKVDLFKPLFAEGNDVENDTDLVFKRLDDPSLEGEPELKRVLELALRVINKNRYSNLTDEMLDKMRDSGNLGYYRVPLTPGKMNSAISAQGMLNAIRSRLKFLLPSKAKLDAINREAGFELLEGEEQQLPISESSDLQSEENLNKTVDIPLHSIHRANLWEMTTMFDAGESEIGRLRLIEDNGLEYFERDLETLILKHEFAYRLRDIMNDILPLIKAGILNILYQLIMQGHEYTEDIQYLEDYVKNKIFNKSLIPDKYKAINAYKSGLMRGASTLALGFNLKQFYLVIEGLWKDIKLIVTKPDGSYNFSSSDMLKAFKDVMKEAFHYGNERSVLELINEFYALNDMDMHPDTYVERVIDDKSLLYNFLTVCFRFSSRPDFYNRQAIFRAHMYHDGCVNAHSKKNGVLVYDWKLDKRFDKVAKYIENGKSVSDILEIARNSNDAVLAKQLGLYTNYVEQMAFEGTKVTDKNGNKRLIQKGDILPKAYTTNQSEAYKSVSDLLYGYYAHEKKALIQSELLGAMLLQMYTYWSGKKNQYALSSGVKINGSFELLEIDGIPQYMDSNGRPTHINTGIAYIVWKGRFEEGILLTLNHIRELIQLGAQEYDKGLIQGLPEGIRYMKKNMFKEVPEELRDAYIHNLKALSYDLFVWLIVGQLAFRSLQQQAKSYVNENEADNLAQAITNNSLSLGTSLLKTSVMDFNFLESIGGRGIDWTPFSISMMTNTYNNWRNFLTGSLSLKKTVEKSTSATRQIHEVFDYIWKDPEE